MTKKEKLTKLLQPYLDADIVTQIPNEVKMGVRDILLDAEDYNLYDEFIDILKNSSIPETDPEKSYFAMMDQVCELLPPLEIVDVDVDVYEEEEDDEEYDSEYGDEEYVE